MVSFLLLVLFFSNTIESSHTKWPPRACTTRVFMWGTVWAIRLCRAAREGELEESEEELELEEELEELKEEGFKEEFCRRAVRECKIGSISVEKDSSF